MTNCMPIAIQTVEPVDYVTTHFCQQYQFLFKNISFCCALCKYSSNSLIIPDFLRIAFYYYLMEHFYLYKDITDMEHHLFVKLLFSLFNFYSFCLKL